MSHVVTEQSEVNPDIQTVEFQDDFYEFVIEKCLYGIQKGDEKIARHFTETVFVSSLRHLMHMLGNGVYVRGLDTMLHDCVGSLISSKDAWRLELKRVIEHEAVLSSLRQCPHIGMLKTNKKINLLKLV